MPNFLIYLAWKIATEVLKSAHVLKKSYKTLKLAQPKVLKLINWRRLIFCHINSPRTRPKYGYFQYFQSKNVVENCDDLFLVITLSRNFIAGADVFREYFRNAKLAYRILVRIKIGAILAQSIAFAQIAVWAINI